MPEDEARALGLAAASQAAIALAELVQFVLEGALDELDGSPFREGVVEQLLDAAKMAIEIEGDLAGERGQVYAAIARFLEGWA